MKHIKSFVVQNSQTTLKYIFLCHIHYQNKICQYPHISYGFLINITALMSVSDPSSVKMLQFCVLFLFNVAEAVPPRTQNQCSIPQAWEDVWFDSKDGNKER